MATGNMHPKFGEGRTCSSEDMITDRQTNTQTRSLQYSAPFPRKSDYHDCRSLKTTLRSQ